MKILFLDFDGVLKPFSTYDKAFSPSACKHLQQLLDKVSDLKIVVSSSHRYRGFEVVKQMLHSAGVSESKIIDTTELSKTTIDADRGYHIQNWINSHPEVKHFVIFDDESIGPDLMTHQVKIDPWIGITESDISKAIQVLT